MNNLKQIGLGAHNYHSAMKVFPPGKVSPSNASALIQILPYLEQASKFNQFDFTSDINSSASNAAARVQDVSVFMCPSDSSSATTNGGCGRSNYQASLGANAGQANTDGTTGGIFFNSSAVRITDITDGTSNTAMYAEIKRGFSSTTVTTSPTAVVAIDYATLWDVALPANDLNYISACNAPSKRTYDYIGLEYFRASVPWTAFYTHTMLPNSPDLDCVRSVGLNKEHLAARSYHPGGVNLLLADGTARFFADSISLSAWKAIGTRAGSEIFSFE